MTNARSFRQSRERAYSFKAAVTVVLRPEDTVSVRLRDLVFACGVLRLGHVLLLRCVGEGYVLCN